MIIATPRLLLRPARPDDLAGLHAVMSDPRAMRYWSCPAHGDIGQTRAFLQGMIDAPRDQSCDFIVEHRGRVIGKAGAWRYPELGFILHPEMWGQGLAREALSAIITRLFATTTLPRLTAEADQRNAASLGLLGALGFHETGRAANTLLWGDEWCDSVYLALERGHWPPPPGAGPAAPGHNSR
ncbi:GNAT family N-acetyltransferase [Paracoccaceae bacterium Fryx2]|nr:GNAT family N-acetyltransferase [Paracoccaceae bacterium Fryx2]